MRAETLFSSHIPQVLLLMCGCMWCSACNPCRCALSLVPHLVCVCQLHQHLARDTRSCACGEEGTSRRASEERQGQHLHTHTVRKHSQAWRTNKHGSPPVQYAPIFTMPMPTMPTTRPCSVRGGSLHSFLTSNGGGSQDDWGAVALGLNRWSSTLNDLSLPSNSSNDVTLNLCDTHAAR